METLLFIKPNNKKCIFKSPTKFSFQKTLLFNFGLTNASKFDAKNNIKIYGDFVASNILQLILLQ